MKITRQSLLFGIIVFECLIIACMTIQQAEKRVTEAQKELPLPSDAVLLAGYLKNASGSQDECVGAISTQVFGSNQAFDEILNFYHSCLLEAGWKPDKNKILPTFTKAEDNLSVSLILLDSQTGGTSIGRTIQSTIAANQSKFRTFFQVELFFSTCR